MNPSDLPQGSAPRPTRKEAAESARKLFRWVPIRALSARHRPRILKHLLALADADRYLRFGSLANDAQISHYVDLIDFESDEVFGIFNRRLQLLAVAHLAFGHAKPAASRFQPETPSAEFGVSVLAKARGRGYGSHLFERAVLHARNRGVERLVIHALSENKAMLLIARKAGSTVVRDGSESQAELTLPPNDLSSHVEQLVEDTAAEIDFQLKANVKIVGDWLTSLSGDGAKRAAASTSPEGRQTPAPNPASPPVDTANN